MAACEERQTSLVLEWRNGLPPLPEHGLATETTTTNTLHTQPILTSVIQQHHQLQEKQQHLQQHHQHLIQQKQQLQLQQEQLHSGQSQQLQSPGVLPAPMLSAMDNSMLDNNQIPHLSMSSVETSRAAVSQTSAQHGSVPFIQGGSPPPMQPWQKSTSLDPTPEEFGREDRSDGESESSFAATASECPTEIFVPSLTHSHAQPVCHRQQYLRGGSDHLHLPPAIIPRGYELERRASGSVTSGGDSAVHGRHRNVTSWNASDGAGTNLDSGISNETDDGRASLIQGKRIHRSHSSCSSSSHCSSTYSCDTAVRVVNPSIGRRCTREREHVAQSKRSKVFTAINWLSFSYCTILISLGVICPFLRSKFNEKEDLDLQGFYIYLYMVGIVFLIYEYSSVVQLKTQERHYYSTRGSEATHSQTTRPPGGSRSQTTCASGVSKSQSSCPSRAPTSQSGASRGSSAKRKPQQTSAPDAGGPQHQRSASNHRHHHHHSIGGIVLRIGAVVFCVGSVVDNCLKFGEQVTVDCGHLLYKISPLAQAIFVSLQIYFVVINAKLSNSSYPLISKFGLMHVIATNTCLWIQRLAMEVDPHPFYPLSSDLLTTLVPPGLTTTITPAVGLKVNGTSIFTTASSDLSGNACSPHPTLAAIVKGCKPYLYPCTAQFCLIASAILLLVWRDISSESDSNCTHCPEQRPPSSGAPVAASRLVKSPTLISTSPPPLDCKGISRGLFAAIPVLVAGIVSLILFFVFSKDENSDQSDSASVTTAGSLPLLILHIYEIVVYCLILLAAATAILKVRNFDFDIRHSSTWSSATCEELLLGVSMAALFAKDMTSVIAGLLFMRESAEGSVLSLTAAVAHLSQSFVQLTLVALGLRLSCWRRDVERRIKPGRELVTFLIGANTALWVVGLAAERREMVTPSLLRLLGASGWNVFVNVLGPVVSFYHFFMAACLCTMWYCVYQRPRGVVTGVSV